MNLLDNSLSNTHASFGYVCHQHAIGAIAELGVLDGGLNGICFRNFGSRSGPAVKLGYVGLFL